MKKQTVRDIDVAGKRVLLRVDYNVQVDEGGVVDDTRLRESIQTIETLRAAGAKIVICSHRGRPRGEVVDAQRNAPVAAHLSRLLEAPVASADECVGPAANAAVAALEPGGVLLLENVRFHPEETDNDPDFARELASLADIYVSDAFGTAHRAHASIVGIPEHLPAVAGLLMEREVDFLSEVTHSPERPFGLVLGGAKTQDKLPILDYLCEGADVVCIGGGMANTFLVAQGHDVQDSLYEEAQVDRAREVLASVGARDDIEFLLPDDVVVSYGAPESGSVTVVAPSDVPSGWRILDIGPATIEKYARALKGSRTAVWNGPMGMFEQERFAHGSLDLARIFATLDATTVVGGGETAAAIHRAGVGDFVSHISTGGTAFIAMLAGQSLPGVDALLDA
ncbi:MAG TPA: phosphoglycerate kinase [Dehalococcoidia bacterium]|jgi:phosphoglycerate kinase|nr:phosphoglycerate kinase [Dehalococcoidia bacterium]